MKVELSESESSKQMECLPKGNEEVEVSAVPSILYWQSPLASPLFISFQQCQADYDQANANNGEKVPTSPTMGAGRRSTKGREALPPSSYSTCLLTRRLRGLNPTLLNNFPPLSFQINSCLDFQGT
jgi:hypothetical protein